MQNKNHLAQRDLSTEPTQRPGERGPGETGTEPALYSPVRQPSQPDDLPVQPLEEPLRAECKPEGLPKMDRVWLHLTEVINTVCPGQTISMRIEAVPSTKVDRKILSEERAPSILASRDELEANRKFRQASRENQPGSRFSEGKHPPARRETKFQPVGGNHTWPRTQADDEAIWNPAKSVSRFVCIPQANQRLFVRREELNTQLVCSLTVTGWGRHPSASISRRRSSRSANRR